MTDCLIIGGGVIGLLTARVLALAGAQVTLIERGHTGREASWAAGGILSPLYPWRTPKPVNSLAAWSQRCFPSLSQELHASTGIDPEWTRSGLLVLDHDEESTARAWSQCDDIPLSIFNADQTQHHEPMLAATGNNALWLPHIAQIRSPRLLQALKLSVSRLNVRIEEGIEVSDLLIKNQRITGVETSHGPYLADTVVVASGAWSGKLLDNLGIDLEINPVRGQMILFRCPPGLLSCIVLYKDYYLIPRRDGNILMGSTVEQTGFAKATTEDALMELRAIALQLMPVLADCPVEHHWAGLRPGSPTGIPYIGAYPGIRGLYVNTGHFRNGIALAPASAQLLADMMSGSSPILDADPYSLYPNRLDESVAASIDFV